MRMIDSHLHVIDLSALSYPWLDDFAPLRRDFRIDAYEIEARRCGVTDALHMEVDVHPDEIDKESTYVQGLSRKPHALIRGCICSCRPEERGFPDRLERVRCTSFVRGFRRVLHTQPDDLSENPLFRENLNRLADTGLPFDICVAARQLKKAIALVDACPRVQFVLDHCGVPAIKDGVLHPWREDMADLADRPNVAVKISGVIAYASETWTLAEIRPFVELPIERFGWDRVVWGSDWPVCTLNGSLSTWVAATRALIDECSREEAEKFLSGNARRLWRPDA
jgi:predicted TIM-barrel fold metal-dependent hydrolase